jgi:hypothetical protein
MKTISFALRGDEWAVTLDDHDGGKSEVLGSYPGRAEAVEAALHAARVRGLELAEPMADRA